MSGLSANLKPLSASIAVAQSTAEAAGIGPGQTLQDVLSSRAANTVYTNSTGKTIVVFIVFGSALSSSIQYAYVNGAVVARNVLNTGAYDTESATLIINDGDNYKIDDAGAGIVAWVEIR